jgi:predicted membrane channel-forming protein YqfA (hemolysin III family)
MKHTFLKYFSQPAPIDERPWQKIILSVLLVTFILAVFEPFNFKLRTIGQLWILIGFALVIMLVTSVVYVVFPKIFKRFYQPDNWTVGRSLLNNLWFLLLAAVGVVCYDYFIIMKQLPEYFPSGFLVDLFAVLTIGIVPLSITTLMVQN